MTAPDGRFTDLLRDVKRQFRIDVRGLHGAPHWARVQANGLRLAERTGADITVVKLFSLIHDSQRHDEGHDPEHGDRAAMYVAHATRHFKLTEEQRKKLVFACSLHSDGRLTEDATIGTCWDADRLDLARVGILLDPKYLSTEAARDPAMIEWAYKRSIKV